MRKHMKRILYAWLIAGMLIAPVTASAKAQGAEAAVPAETAVEAETEVLDPMTAPEDETGEETQPGDAPEEEKPEEKPEDKPVVVKADGIHKIDGKRYYYKGGELQYGLQEVVVDGTRCLYYFEEDGAAAVGFRTINGKSYYFRYSGRAVRSTCLEYMDKGKTYVSYFQADGTALTNQYKVATKLSRADEGGYLTDITEGRNHRYYFRNNGRAYTGGFLQYTDGTTTCYSYFPSDTNGDALTGTTKLVSVMHAVTSTGLIKDIADGEKHRYYFASNAKAFTKGYLQFADSTGKTVGYFFKSNGEAYTGGYLSVSTRYQADAQGKTTKMASGTKGYYFQNNGKAYTGGLLQFEAADGTPVYYYFQSDGTAYKKGYMSVASIHKINASGDVQDISDGQRRRYYFQKNGQAYTNGFLKFVHTNGKTYYFYFQSNGEAYCKGYRSAYKRFSADASGNLTDIGDKKWHYYYFQTNGQAFTEGFLRFVHTNGKVYRYYFQEDGSAYAGYKNCSIRHSADSKGNIKDISNDKRYRYYFQKNGQAFSNGFLRFKHTNGKTYLCYAGSDGRWFASGQKTAIKTLSAAAVDGTITDISDGNYYGCTFNADGLGTMITSQWLDISGTKAYFDVSGMRVGKSNGLYKAWTKISMENSRTKYYVVVDTDACETYTFYGSAGSWVPLKCWKCSPGKPSTPTILGKYTIRGKGDSFSLTECTCYYYTQISGNYLFHSILYHRGTWDVMNGRLGKQLSHGCIRLATENAKWFFDNLPIGTAVYIYGYTGENTNPDGNASLADTV